MARGLMVYPTGGNVDGVAGDNVLLAPPLTETPRIQEVHLVTYHAICAALDARLLGEPSE